MGWGKDKEGVCRKRGFLHTIFHKVFGMQKAPLAGLFAIGPLAVFWTSF